MSVPSLARLFWIAMVMLWIGLALRFAWPWGWFGVIVGYGLTLAGIALCLSVIRRGRADRER